MLKKKSFQTFALLKGYAQKSQLGEIFTFDKLSTGTDGVFRTTSRGWYTFAHLALALIFFFGHLWYGGRALFSDLSAGITILGVYWKSNTNCKQVKCKVGCMQGKQAGCMQIQTAT